MAFCQSSEFLTSHSFPLILCKAFTADESFCGFLPSIKVDAPFSEQLFAVALPIPEVPPAITIRLPLNSKLMLLPETYGKDYVYEGISLTFYQVHQN